MNEQHTISQEIINQPETNNSKKGISVGIYLFSLILAIIFGALALYLFQFYKTKSIERPLTDNNVLPTLVDDNDQEESLKMAENSLNYTIDNSNVSISYPASYKVNVNSNIGSIRLIGEDYFTDCSEMCFSSGSMYAISRSDTCEVDEGFNGENTLIESASNYEIYSIPGMETPDSRLALVKSEDACIQIYCNSNNSCQGEMYEEFKSILSSVNFSKDPL